MVGEIHSDVREKPVEVEAPIRPSDAVEFASGEVSMHEAEATGQTRDGSSQGRLELRANASVTRA